MPLPFIIFGTRSSPSVVRAGMFLCPCCTTPEAYDLVRVRQYFTLFFLPVFPIGTRGQYVECGRCGSTYDEAILEHQEGTSEREFESYYDQALRRCLAEVILADGVIRHGELDAMHGALMRYGYSPLGREETEAIFEVIEAEDQPLEDYLERVSPQLNRQGREDIIRAMLAVMAADNDVDEREAGLVDHVAGWLGVTAEDMRALVAAFGRASSGGA